MVPELPSQPGQKPAAHQPDLQHGLGRADVRTSRSWCSDTGKNGYTPNGRAIPTAQTVSCTTVNPDGGDPQVAFLQELDLHPRQHGPGQRRLGRTV